MSNQELLKHCLFALNSIPNTDIGGYGDHDVSTTYELASKIDKFFRERSKEPWECPRCGHEEIHRYNHEGDVGYKLDYVECEKCKTRWTESWTFDGWWFDETGE